MRHCLLGGNSRYSRFFTNTGRCTPRVKPLVPYMVGKLFNKDVSSDPQLYAKYGLDFVYSEGNGSEMLASVWYRVYRILDRRRKRQLFFERLKRFLCVEWFKPYEYIGVFLDRCGYWFHFGVSVGRIFWPGIGWGQWGYRYYSVAYKKKEDLLDEEVKFLFCEAKVRLVTWFSRLRLIIWERSRLMGLYMEGYGKGYPIYAKFVKFRLWDRLQVGCICSFSTFFYYVRGLYQTILGLRSLEGQRLLDEWIHGVFRKPKFMSKSGDTLARERYIKRQFLGKRPFKRRVGLKTWVKNT